MQGVYFAWLWLARVADFTMNGLISEEVLAPTAHGRDLCRLPWGCEALCIVTVSPDSFSQGSLIYDPECEIHSLPSRLKSVTVHKLWTVAGPFFITASPPTEPCRY